MKQMKRLGALALALAMSLTLLAGCGPKGDDSSSASGSDSASASSSGDTAPEIEPMDLSAVTDPYLATSGVAGDTVVATVGDADITAADLLYWLNSSVSLFLSQMGGMLPPWDTDLGDGQTIGSQFKEGALESAAFYRLLPLVAQKEGLSPSPEAEATLRQQMDALIAEMGGEEPVDHALWFQMATWEQLLTLSQAADLHLQLQELYFGEGSEGYPTDAEVNAYLDEQGLYRAKHILVMAADPETREPLDEAAIAEKKAQAEDILAQIRAADDPIAKFDELMKELSEDPGLATNPDGYVAQKGQMVTEFEQAALALENGEISDVVYSPSTGFHIILRLPLDPADYRDALVGSNMSELADQWLEEYGVETTEAFDQIDMTDFWDKLQSLKLAIQQELAALESANSAEAGGSASSAG